MLENQTPPQNIKPPITPPQNPPVSNTPTLKQKTKPALIIVGIIFLLTILAAGTFWFFYNKKSTNIAQDPTSDTSMVSDDSKNTKDSDVDTIVREDDSGTAEEQVMQTEKDSDKMETLIMLHMCYIMKNPEAGLLAPEKWQMDPADLENIDETKREKYNQEKLQFESMCDSLYSFGEEDYDYMGTLLQTDEDEDGVNLYYEKFFESNDNKIDTDEDGYDDLTEINSGNDPNDKLITEYKKMREDMKSLIEEGKLDLSRALDICDSVTSERYRDYCYEIISENINDESFCDSVEFYNAAHLLACRSNILNNQATASGDVENCLKLPSYDQAYCFLGFVKNDSDFENCSLLLLDEYTKSSFVTCAEEVMGNENFKDKNECYKYKEDFESIVVFDNCISSVAINTNDAILCHEKIRQDYVFSAMCVDAVAKKYDNPNNCGANLLYEGDDGIYISFSGELGNSNFENCLKKFVSDDELPTAAFEACKSLPTNNNSNSNSLFARSVCLNGLAEKFNNELYCDPLIDAASKQIEKDNKIGQCYSPLIEEFNREDLCSFIKNGDKIQWLANLKKDGHCLDY